MIRSGDKVLFQGDSITDAGRQRELDKANSPSALGYGYAGMAAGRLLAERAGEGPKVYNRGISGNRVVDLYARWKIDAINLAPDVLSILIGVNDTWHRFERDNGVEVPRYEQVYRMLLDLTKERLPEVRLILCEPFVLPCGVVVEGWREEIDARREIVVGLAKDYGAAFVPFQAAFDEALERAPAPYWADDGVHPTSAGHALMAEVWLRAVEGD